MHLAIDAFGLPSPVVERPPLNQAPFGRCTRHVVGNGRGAARFLGETGVYALSVGGGVLSSASTVASAANLSTAGSLSARVAGHSAIIASVASAMVDLPLVSRFGRDARLTRRVALFIASIAALGAIGVVADLLLP